MKLSETDIVIDLDTGKEWYITNVKDDIIADEIGSGNIQKNVILKGKFRLKSILYGEYDTKIIPYIETIFDL